MIFFKAKSFGEEYTYLVTEMIIESQERKHFKKFEKFICHYMKYGKFKTHALYVENIYDLLAFGECSSSYIGELSRVSKEEFLDFYKISEDELLMSLVK